MIFPNASLSALTLTVGNGSNYADQTVQIPITVDNPIGIAGASFTLTYDSSKITLTDVQSTFFDTFMNQWNSLDTIPNPLPPTSIELGGSTYTQPLIKNPVAPGATISAARCTPSDNSSNTLLVLSFTLKPGASVGGYAIGVSSSVIDDTAAGYDESGKSIPVLMGADLSRDITDPLAFPVLLDPNDQSVGGTLVAGSVTFNIISGTDTDGDGIWDDGDESGQIDNFCVDGGTSNCDDNCTDVDNADQTDTDRDGFGNACDDDDDDDGMPDVYEALYDGLDPLINDADEDLDHDRLTNYEEYIEGSDPTDRNDPKNSGLPFLPLLLDN